jgi:hypothetical protein
MKKMPRIEYKCPNCGRTYAYGAEGWFQCMNCNYPLKKSEDVKVIRTPHLNEHQIIGEIDGLKNIPKCPTCQSSNVKKIGNLERAGSVAMLGIFSKKINKSFKCQNCGYTW